MKNTNLAIMVLVAALSACNNNQGEGGLGAPDASAAVNGGAPQRIPSSKAIRAWRESRDGYQYNYESFEVSDLQCRNLTSQEIPKVESKIRSNMSFDEFFEIAIKCSYRYKAERHGAYSKDTRESLNRQVTDELWYIARSEDASLRYWRGSNGLPGKPLY
jgi:hypothetical protein